jgi:hypothetical protein
MPGKIIGVNLGLIEIKDKLMLTDAGWFRLYKLKNKKL